ncbi:MAG: bacteriocin fulvocin C-related protein [Bacteroidetes bacterium]|nr:bacteriocin fulvocin C-related protein [Bacteroidota bacterium]
MKNRLKKISGIFTVIAMLFFTSCEKDINVQSNSLPIASGSSKELSGAELRQALLLLGPIEQRNAFNASSANSKYLIWKDKLDQVLSINSITTGQRSSIESIYNELSPEIFVEDSDKQGDFQNRFEPNWSMGARQQFEQNAIASIVSSLEDFDPSGPVLPPNTDDCDCSLQSDWCPYQFTCMVDVCSPTVRGCGTLWTYKCKGNCFM